jgi:hypothetical protein
MGTIAHPSEAIWLPGAGELRFDELHAARAVEEYDSDLMLGQDKRSGQWAVFLKYGPESDGQPFPVLGLGHELPSPERIREILTKADVRRNGRQIVAEIERTQQRAEDEFAAQADEAQEAVAESIISHMNAEGTNPFPSVHMGGKYGNGRVRSSG